MEYDVKDLALAPTRASGASNGRTESMPVLRPIRERFAQGEAARAACASPPACTSPPRPRNLMRTLAAGGAEVVLCASNPLSTQDDVAAALVADYGIPTFAIKGEDNDTYYPHIDAALDHKPHITMDDGADLVTLVLTRSARTCSPASSAAPRRRPPA